jgi:hypothetical protein
MQCLTAGFLSLAVLFVFGSPATAAASATVRNVEVEGTAFRVTLSDGRIIAQDQLPGTILALGDGTGRQRRIRIDGVERDRQDAAGEIVLYTLSEQDPESGEWRNLCRPDPDGRRLGFPLAGAFTPDAHYEAARGRILLTCTGGAEGKCVRFGYKPWGFGPDNVSLAPYFQACVRDWSAPIIAVMGPPIHAMARRSIYSTRSEYSAPGQRRK